VSAFRYDEIGQRLRAFRLASDLSADEISRRIGISRTALYRLERGELVKIETLEKLAGLLDVSIPTLLGVHRGGDDVRPQSARVAREGRGRAAVRAHWKSHPPEFAAFLDLRLEELGDGLAVMRLPFRTEIANGAGAVHGGAIASLCDTAFYVAHATVFGWEQTTVTTTLTCNFLAPARAATDLLARATVIKPGKRIVFGEVTVHAAETLVAHATLSYLNVAG